MLVKLRKDCREIERPYHHAPCGQVLELCDRLPRRLLEELMHDGIVARIAPVWLSDAALPEIVEHRPGVVRLDATEIIAIIPVVHLRQLILGKALVAGKRFGLCTREAEPLDEPKVHGGVHDDVVEPREYRLATHALNAREAG